MKKALVIVLMVGLLVIGVGYFTFNGRGNLAYAPAPPADPTANWSREQREAVNVMDDLLGQLRAGKIAYTAPTEVDSKGEIEVGAAVGVEASSEELIAELEKHFPAIGVFDDSLQVSEVMVGTIESRGFDFYPPDPIVQIVSAQQPTVWRWRGVPKETGEQTIVVTMSARLKLNDQLQTDRLVETWRTKITVKVSVWDLVVGFVVEHIEFVWGSLLLPLIVLAWKWLQSKKKLSRSDPS